MNAQGQKAKVEAIKENMEKIATQPPPQIELDAQQQKQNIAEHTTEHPEDTLKNIKEK